MGESSSVVRIRDAAPEDLALVRALTLESYREYANVMAPEAWSALEHAITAALDSNDPAERMVAELNGRVVGGVMLYPSAAAAYDPALAQPDWPEVRLLAVSPTARGYGVGRALMEECVRRAQRLGAVELGLHTSASMRAAIRTYERMGFVRAPAFDFQPPGAELVTAYRLDISGGT